MVVPADANKVLTADWPLVLLLDDDDEDEDDGAEDLDSFLTTGCLIAYLNPGF